MLDHKNLDQFAGFNKVKLNLTNPNMRATIDYKELSIMCGKNGIGKSFSNKLTWVNVFVMNLFLIEETMGVKLNENFTREETLQFVLDSTFEEPDFTGTIKYYSTDKIMDVPYFIIEYTLTDGKVSNLVVDHPENPKPSGLPVYMSKETRQFAYIDRYVVMKDLLNVDLQTFEGLEKIIEHFRIYDVFAMETLLQKLPKMPEVLKTVKSSSDMLDDLDIASIEYSTEKKALCYTDSHGALKKVTTLGDGHQAILIMMIGVVPVGGA